MHLRHFRAWGWIHSKLDSFWCWASLHSVEMGIRDRAALRKVITNGHENTFGQPISTWTPLHLEEKLSTLKWGIIMIQMKLVKFLMTRRNAHDILLTGGVGVGEQVNSRWKKMIFIHINPFLTDGRK